MFLPQYLQSLCCNTKDFYDTLLAFLCHVFTFNKTDKKIDFRSFTFFHILRTSKVLSFTFDQFQDNGVNITTAYVDITWLRRHRHYQTYLNWSQSLVLGFIPVALLIYFNGRIYQDIR